MAAKHGNRILNFGNTEIILYPSQVMQVCSYGIVVS